MIKVEHFASNLDSLARQLLPPDIYARRGVKGLEVVNPLMIEFLEVLRVHLGVPLLVNGAGYTQSGVRGRGFYSTAKKYADSLSQHKYGNAVDVKAKGMEAHDVRKHVIENKHLYPMISFIEVGPVWKDDKEVPQTWSHFDCRSRITEDPIRYWSPVLGFVSEDRVLSEEL